MEIHIVANAALGEHLSGGDRIFIECARRWARRGHRVFVYVWEEGLEMCRRNRLEGVEFVLWPAARFRPLGFGLTYLARTIVGIASAMRMKGASQGRAVVYSASDFWPDSIPAFILSRALGAPWVAGFYLFAPSPVKGFSRAWAGPLGVPRPRDILYYLHQRPVYSLVKRAARSVFVTCEDDRERFIGAGRSPGDVVAVRGGVDPGEPEARQAQAGERGYEACFVGRLHPQKGLIELVAIWGSVARALPGARLAVIGAGPDGYAGALRAEIRRSGLEASIDLLGFMDGADKHAVFRRSRVIVHPAVYDSGGMAACEGMAWGLPAVGFDLPALRRYYPRGMLKALPGDTDDFAAQVVRLLTDAALHDRTRQDALSLAADWGWDSRAQELLSHIEERLGR